MTLQVRVQRIAQETAEVRVFKLVPATGQALPPFTAGAHIDVYLPGGLVRPYSLCNDPRERDVYCIGVKREPASRGGSATLHAQVREGDVLQVSEPRNHFPLAPNATHHLLLGAGIGITPLLAMGHALAAQSASYELHDFARSQDLMAFQEALLQPQFAGHVHFHIGLSPDTVQATLDRLLQARREGAHLYLCGPRPFMDAVRAIAAATAWPQDAVHFEYFTADALAGQAPGDRFTVRLARSGGEYAIPAERSIVQVLSEQGVEVFTSCEQGVCGTCITGVLEGTPDHRDSYLTEEERERNDTLMPCVSRACSPVLVLDI